MELESYREIFHYVTFPVFAIKKDGKLVYRNLACAKYLPGIYGSRTVKTRIYPEIPETSRAVFIWGEPSYSVALALVDGEYIIFLCFSRFQYLDGKGLADKLLESWGNTLLDFLVNFRRAIACTKEQVIGSCFNDVDMLLFSKGEHWTQNAERYSLPHIFIPVFQRMRTSFASRGYCFSAEIEKNFPEYLPVQIAVNDFLFLFGKLLYMTMKFSSTRRLDINLFTEIMYARHGLVLTTDTDLKELPAVQGNNVALLKAMIPEYEAEIELLERIGIVKHTDFSIRLDALGKLTVTYYFAYQTPDWGHVQSMDDFEITISGDIENMIQSILARFTDTDASC